MPLGADVLASDRQIPHLARDAKKNTALPASVTRGLPRIIEASDAYLVRDGSGLLRFFGRVNEAGLVPRISARIDDREPRGRHKAATTIVSGSMVNANRSQDGALEPLK